MARRASSILAPIDVDHDSDATLSSDSDVQMEDAEDADFEVAGTAPRLKTPAGPSRHTSTATFSGSMAAARDSLFSAASLKRGGRDVANASRTRAVVSTNTTNGKKRRLSSPPPFRENDGKPAVLDFRLTPVAKRVERATRFIDDDEDDGDEETKRESNVETVGEQDWVKSAGKPALTPVGAMNRVTSERTWVCGQWLGRCTLEFHTVYVKVTLWTHPTDDGNVKQAFYGSIQCRQLERFSLSRDPAPYYAILQLARGVGCEPAFAHFYDTIFAQVTDKDGPAVVPDIFGAVLFFDDDLELARCQSFGDMSKGMRILLEKPISDEESAQVQRLKHVTSASHSPTRSSTGVLSMITGTVKGTIDTISHLFSPDRSPQKLRLDASETSDPDFSAMSSRFRTSSRRKSFLQQSSKDAEVVVQLSGETDRESGENVAAPESAAERRSTKGVLQLMRQHQKKETQRLASERKGKLLLTYPFDESARPGQITITYGDIDRLKPGEFLNDSIIDFYLRYLWRHAESWQQPQLYFFSSHFFTQLCGGKLTGGVSVTEERLARVARWTQKENLFEKRFLFVPINDSCHWSIAVLCNPGSAIIHKYLKKKTSKQAQAANIEVVDLANEAVVVDTTDDASDFEEDNLLQRKRMEQPPCVLFLDSLRCHQKKKICSLLRSYLEYEYKTRFETQEALPDPVNVNSALSTTSISTFDSEAIKLIEPEIPLQSNSSDCGVFLLLYTAQILQRFPLGLSEEDVTSKLASSTSKQMFDDSHVQEFRDYLHQLIFTLQKIDRRGGSEFAIKSEGLEFFAVES